MKLLRWFWTGWMVAAVALAMFVVGAAHAQTIAPPAAPPAVDAHLVIQSDGTFYLVHDGVRFQLPLEDMSDVQLRSIPIATQEQWYDHFTGPIVVPPPAEQAPFPGYS